MNKLAVLITTSILMTGCNETENKKTNQLTSDTSWIYNQSKDEMRGTNTESASLVSDNTVNFNAPYDGGSKLAISIKKTTDDPINVGFTITKGQYSCDTVRNQCHATIKFDNGDLEQVDLADPQTGASTLLFIKNKEDAYNFVKNTYKSKKVIIELPFYSEGTRQFTFTLKPLKWKEADIQSEADFVTPKIAENDIDAAP